MEIIKLITLGLSGLLLSFVGLMRLTSPIKTYAKNSGITLERNVNLLNEIRGASSLMLCSGIIILLGMAMPALTDSSFVVASLVFIGFAIGRIFSIGIDGKPNKQLIQGLIFELVLGSLNVYCIFQ
ncbi:MAG: DUF4345 domain-containing protein [Ekhidna sp.]